MLPIKNYIIRISISVLSLFCSYAHARDEIYIPTVVSSTLDFQTADSSLLKLPASRVPIAMISTPGFRTFVEKMITTRQFAKGAGLSANQVGSNAARCLVLFGAAGPHFLGVPRSLIYSVP